MNVYLDFDGTVVAHEYPELGSVNPNALQIIKKLQDAGHNIILNTMRAEFKDGSLEEAFEYLNSNANVTGIKITQATARKISPPRWSLKDATDEIYIDDIAADIPLIAARVGFMVDWQEVERQLIENGILEASFTA